MSPDSFSAAGALATGGSSYRIFRVNAIDGAARLPFSLKILLEKLLRNEDGHLVTAAQIEALAGWDPAAEPSAEIASTPARVLLQDSTGLLEHGRLAGRCGACEFAPVCGGTRRTWPRWACGQPPDRDNERLTWRPSRWRLLSNESITKSMRGSRRSPPHRGTRSR